MEEIRVKGHSATEAPVYSCLTLEAYIDTAASAFGLAGAKVSSGCTGADNL